MIEHILRLIITFFIVGFLYPLYHVTSVIGKEMLEKKKVNAVQLALITTSVTLILSGLLTLFTYVLVYTNSQSQITTYAFHARNLLKNMGIFIGSWAWYYASKKGR